MTIEQMNGISIGSLILAKNSAHKDTVYKVISRSSYNVLTLKAVGNINENFTTDSFNEDIEVHPGSYFIDLAVSFGDDKHFFKNKTHKQLEFKKFALDEIVWQKPTPKGNWNMGVETTAVELVSASCNFSVTVNWYRSQLKNKEAAFKIFESFLEEIIKTLE